jgi:signal peptidase I
VTNVAAPPVSPPSSKSSPSGARNVVEWVLIIAAALIVAVVIKTFLIQAFYIPSASMDPTLKVHDRVLVNKLSYHLHPIHRGDIVVFKRPQGEQGDPTIKDLIKRVVGLPGETIEAREGKLYVDNHPVDETYTHFKPTDNLQPTKIPPNHYFVMGDNRTNSKDSRYFGPIPKNIIVGRAFVRVWPVSSFGLL